ncbi:MAG: tRNA (adenosine(37)-N6)-threonylcarbamoyltransferase complex transferase subunit TsaD [Burkholderiales bacterium]|nr:tRNA (adenosine(37)-N6)-threonylcarbamoyltransferase complex transferase subunit TsaD [Burkholderiales bacterium]
MLILGLETSCDETGIGLFDTSKGLLAERLHSQVSMHSAYGGVVPELASRDHIKRLIPLLNQTLAAADRRLGDIDAIAYTAGPGLGGALLTGAGMASGLGLALGKPLIQIHHLEGHLLSPMLSGDRPSPPYVALLVSGGHTQLMHVTGVGHYRLLGETIDDAAGEAFDKSASLLGLPYPGGPALSMLAEAGCAQRYPLPRPMLRSGDLHFSFSGLKTAVALLVREQSRKTGQIDAQQQADIAASFQAAVVDVLVAKCLSALSDTGARDLVVAGGVGANRSLRQRLADATSEIGARALFPPPNLCTDNGAMIAHAAALRFAAGIATLEDPHRGFDIHSRWELEPRGQISQATRADI